MVRPALRWQLRSPVQQQQRLSAAPARPRAPGSGTPLVLPPQLPLAAVLLTHQSAALRAAARRARLARPPWPPGPQSPLQRQAQAAPLVRVALLMEDPNAGVQPRHQVLAPRQARPACRSPVCLPCSPAGLLSLSPWRAHSSAAAGSLAALGEAVPPQPPARRRRCRCPAPPPRRRQPWPARGRWCPPWRRQRQLSCAPWPSGGGAGCARCGGRRGRRCLRPPSAAEG